MSKDLDFAYSIITTPPPPPPLPPLPPPPPKTFQTLPEVLPPSVIPFWKPLMTPDLDPNSDANFLQTNFAKSSESHVELKSQVPDKAPKSTSFKEKSTSLKVKSNSFKLSPFSLDQVDSSLVPSYFSEFRLPPTLSYWRSPEHCWETSVDCPP